MKGQLQFMDEIFMLNCKKGKRGALKESVKTHSLKFDNKDIRETKNFKEASFTVIHTSRGEKITLVGGLMPQRVHREYKATAIVKVVYLK
jgi:hypothetical protein